MKENITFCEECRKDVAFSILELQLVNELKGEAYKHIGKKAICDECGSEVYVAVVDDFNLKELYNEYRKRTKIALPGWRL